jgi:hypothetical protein
MYVCMYGCVYVRTYFSEKFKLQLRNWTFLIIQVLIQFQLKYLET